MTAKAPRRCAPGRAAFARDLASALLLATLPLSAWTPAATAATVDLDTHSPFSITETILLDWEPNSIFETLELPGLDIDEQTRADLLQQAKVAAEAALENGYSVARSQPQVAINAGVDAILLFGKRKDALDLIGIAFAHARRLSPSDGLDADNRDVEIEIYERLLQRHPDWPELLFRTASQQIALERLRPEAFDHLERAERYLHHLVEVLPDHADARTRGQAHFQYGRALKHLEDSRPQADLAAGDLPLLYLQAARQFERTLEADPSRLDAVGETVLVYLSAERPDLALQAIEASYAAFTHPSLIAKLHEMEGRMHLDMGNAPEARREFKAALALDDTRDASYLTLARIHQMSGDTEAARAVLDRGAIVRPDTLDILFAKARLQQDTDPTGAMLTWRALLSVPPERAVTLGMRPSPERYRTGLYAEAAAALAALIETHGGRAEDARIAQAISERLGHEGDAD